MVNISIISACNNNCKYCFQQDDYHNLGLMLSYKEIEEILDWSRGSQRIAILGGEPTLHPDIVKILKKCLKCAPTLIFSNLLGETRIMEKIIKETPYISWLVNTTTRDELKSLFEENMELFLKNRIMVSLGITLMMDEDYDTRSIENMIRLGKKYHEIVAHYRLGIATPFHKDKVELLCYDEPVLKFCEMAKKETPSISIGFDCPTNMCQITPSATAKLLEEYKVQGVRMANTCGPIFDVMVDKSIKYCSSVPDDFIPIKSYKQFKDWRECYMYLLKFRDDYMMKYGHSCREHDRCNNGICAGICFATTEYFRRQGMIKERTIAR